MVGHLAVISENVNDLGICHGIARQANLSFYRVKDREDLNSFLSVQTNVVVFWDVQDQEKFSEYAGILDRSIRPQKVFAITQNAIDEYPYLAGFPGIGTHILRRYDGAATGVITRLAMAALETEPFGLSRYVPGAKVERLPIKNAGHKLAAINAVQSYLGKQGIPNRLATLVAQAIDELLMNAIFRAPLTPYGNPKFTEVITGVNFELEDRERVTLEFASCPGYMAFCIGDLFGSLQKRALMKALKPDATMGLSRVLNGGFSLAFVSKPGERTDVMLFFPKVDDLRSFRNSFRFFSLLGPFAT